MDDFLPIVCEKSKFVDKNWMKSITFNIKFMGCQIKCHTTNLRFNNRSNQQIDMYK